MKRLIIAFLIIGGIGGGVAAYYMRGNKGELQVNTVAVSRGEIIDAVGSTGTLQPVTSVTVGSQVSGNISELGTDFNKFVKKGQIIAKIDPTLFQAQVDQSKANLEKSQADLDRNKVALEDSQQKMTRAEGLLKKQLLTQADYDSAVIAVKTAEANLHSAEKTVVQAEAALQQNQTNVDHCIITAPIDGIVTQRSVDVGQTVAASMSAPTLFIIAADLTKMQVNASIDESDVGRIRPGQKVTFRVDAYPGAEFNGAVTQVRLQPTVVQNVTTYSTIINVPNPDFRLKPGMTANLKIQIERREDAVRVPNAAIRFRPTNDMFAALNQPVPPEASGRGGRGGTGANGNGGGRNAGNGGNRGGQSAPAVAANSASGEGGSAPTSNQAVAPRGSDNGAPAADNGGRGRGGRRGGADAAGGNGGNGSAGGGRGGGRGGPMTMDRFMAMPPDQQQQYLDRAKQRGDDVKQFEAALSKASAAKQNAAETIDALFPPLVVREQAARVWKYEGGQLKPVNIRTGITDGNTTELIGGGLEAGAELVTGMVLPGQTRQATPANGNPLLGGRGPGGPGGGRGPGR